MRKRGKTIFWPQYFDSKRSRRLGRRLPLDKSLPLPDIQDVAEAALKLGYDIEIDTTAKYPRTWWDPPGLLLIQTHGQKKKNVMEKLVPKIIQIKKQKQIENTSKKSKKKKKKKK